MITVVSVKNSAYEFQIDKICLVRNPDITLQPRLLSIDSGRALGKHGNMFWPAITAPSLCVADLGAVLLAEAKSLSRTSSTRCQAWGQGCMRSRAI
jgi:hypothetical protein